jgi:hypothetical protein
MMDSRTTTTERPTEAPADPAVGGADAPTADAPTAEAPAPSTGEAPAPSTGDTKRLSTAEIARSGQPESTGRIAAPADAATPSDQTGGDRSTPEPLFDETRAGELRARWDAVQTSFVDEPRNAVERAGALVAEVMQQLASTFAAERQSLERQWTQGDDVSTEDLRVALRRYRSFFGRLLSV